MEVGHDPDQDRDNPYKWILLHHHPSRSRPHCKWVDTAECIAAEEGHAVVQMGCQMGEQHLGWEDRWSDLVNIPHSTVGKMSCLVNIRLGQVIPVSIAGCTVVVVCSHHPNRSVVVVVVVVVVVPAPNRGEEVTQPCKIPETYPRTPTYPEEVYVAGFPRRSRQTQANAQLSVYLGALMAWCALTVGCRRTCRLPRSKTDERWIPTRRTLVENYRHTKHIPNRAV